MRRDNAGLTVRNFTVLLLIFVLVFSHSSYWGFTSTQACCVCRCIPRRIRCRCRGCIERIRHVNGAEVNVATRRRARASQYKQTNNLMSASSRPPCWLHTVSARSQTAGDALLIVLACQFALRTVRRTGRTSKASKSPSGVASKRNASKRKDEKRGRRWRQGRMNRRLEEQKTLK